MKRYSRAESGAFAFSLGLSVMLLLHAAFGPALFAPPAPVPASPRTAPQTVYGPEKARRDAPDAVLTPGGTP